MLDNNGTVRPVWKTLLEALSRMSERELHERFARTDRYLRDAGVFYRDYGKGSSERNWPISHIPVLIDDREWTVLAEGLKQRANLLEAMVADFTAKPTGEGRLCAAGADCLQSRISAPHGRRKAGKRSLPAFLFLRDRAWARWQLVGAGRQDTGALRCGFRARKPGGDHACALRHLCRNPCSPSGLVFGAFRDTLQAQRKHPDDRIAVLTPGPANETYFEHAYIARYLGFMLLEGEDLTVVNGRVMVRTVAGLKPIGVLWRRLDASYSDPLELNQQSHIGTPGMVQALRNEALTIVNALGSGILETRALLAFMPRICRHILGEELKLPSIATWWCGQEAERRHVAGNIEGMVIGPAYSRLPFFDDNGQSVLGSSLRETAKESISEWLASDGHRLVGQEVVKLSTTPAYIDNKLVPRPMSLRVFAARTQDGWQIMPGGFARIGSGDDVSAIAMQSGGSAADVWIVSDRPVERTTLLPAEESFTRNMPGSLPSRAADNLFWLGRYIERSEGALRILRAWHGRYAESADPRQPLLAHVTRYLEALDVEMNDAVPESLLTNINSALYSASNIRDRFSPDGWLALNDLAKTARRFHAKVAPGDDATHAMTVLLRKLAGFAGLVHENMYRFTGWRFLSIGRYLERGLHMTRLLGHMTGPDAPDGSYDMLLEIGDSVMTHRRRYNVNTAGLTVTDLLALDPLNPRSILFQLNEIRTEVEQLPNAFVNGQMSPFYREAMRLHSGLAVMTPENMNGAIYRQLETDMEHLSDVLARTYLG